MLTTDMDKTLLHLVESTVTEDKDSANRFVATKWHTEAYKKIKLAHQLMEHIHKDLDSAEGQHVSVKHAAQIAAARRHMHNARRSLDETTTSLSNANKICAEPSNEL